jgi:hypothetical protein
MPTILSLPLIPNLSPAPTVRRYTYTAGSETVGAVIGSAVAGTVDGIYTHVWDFDVSAWAVGDYWVLIGNAGTPSLYVPVRVNALGAFYEPSWQIMNVAHAAAVVYPSAITGLCDVLFAVTFNGDAVQGASVSATLEADNNTTNGLLAARTVESGTTDASGNCILTLIQFAQFTRGGNYRIRVSDTNRKLLMDRLVVIPATSTANAEDLVDAT